MPPVPPVPSVPSPKWVFTVNFKNDRCKDDAINALNVIKGVEARKDDKGGSLLRDVTVTLTEGAYPQIPGEILKVFGSVQKKFLKFKVTFKDSTQRDAALTVVKALKGVKDVKFEGSATNTPLTLKVIGDADPEIVLNILQKYGARIL